MQSGNGNACPVTDINATGPGSTEKGHVLILQEGGASRFTELLTKTNKQKVLTAQ